MSAAALPPDESGRLAALRSYAILDTLAEEAFDDFVLLAKQLCGVPIAAVSLVDERRQWFKAKVGTGIAETSRGQSFCAHAVLSPGEVFEVQDATQDQRFFDAALVSEEPRVRFYAGAPLVSPEGYALGTICVLDDRPRKLTPEQRAALAALGRRVVSELELRRQQQALASSRREVRQRLTEAGASRRALLSVLEDELSMGSKLREREVLFRQLVDTIREVFWITDAARNRVLYISPSYEVVWGRTCASLYEAPQLWLESVHAEDRRRVSEAVATTQVAGRFDEVYRVVRVDGAIRWVHDKAFPVIEGGSEIRLVGVAEDITDRKELEERFLRAQRLEAVGTLAGGVAHDLNNILTPILMVASLLKPKLADPSDIALLTLMGAGAKRGANIIRQLLSFSRGIEEKRGPVLPRDLFKEMLAIMRETFPRELVLVENLPGDIWAVDGDTTQLHQVLMNLCVNARDAMRTGGTLTLSAANKPLGDADLVGHPRSRAGNFVRLTVADTGHGIPPESRSRIFEPFYTTKEVGEGTGLGLSTVLGIVSSYGGFVTVETAAGRGSAFHVFLPAAEFETDQEVDERASPEQGNQELILIVDDESAIRETLRLILEAANYCVLSAGDGESALAALRSNRGSVRLVVTDIMMPTMNGVSLIEGLRAVAPEVRVVVATGLHDDQQRMALVAAGITSIVAKPCDRIDILTAVQRELAVR